MRTHTDSTEGNAALRAWRGSLSAALAVAAALVVHVPGPFAAVEPARIVAIGDVHGAYDAFVANLRRVGLVDESSRWAGGAAVLVQTGDILDRGARVRDTMDLLMALQEQAKRAGGRVEVLLGNHEAMNLLGDTRDVGAEAYAAFAGPDAEARRAAAWEAYRSLASARAADVARLDAAGTPMPSIYTVPARDAWIADHPPGFVEYLEALRPDGVYGRWLRERPATVRVGDTVFVHGGFDPNVAPRRLDDVNEQVRREIRQFDEARRVLERAGAALPFFRFGEVLEAARTVASLAPAQVAAREAPPAGLQALAPLGSLESWSLVDPEGPLWFRGFATWTTTAGTPRIDALAERYQARRFVVGHTVPRSYRVTPRFGERVFLIDTGMLQSHFEGGRASALEIRGDHVTAVYAEGAIVLAPGPVGAVTHP